MYCNTVVRKFLQNTRNGDDMHYTFGSKLKELRCQKKWSQKYLAEKLNISESVVCRYEKEEVYPQFDTLRSIAVLFNVPMDLLCGTEQREKISVYNLTNKQVEIVNKLVTTFRSRNEMTNKTISQDCCLLLGEILVELSR